MAIANTFARRYDRLSIDGDNQQRPGKRTTRFRFPAGLSALCIALLFVAGCHRGSVNPITINLDPNVTQFLDAGHSQTFLATLAGDLTNKGVKWTLTLNGNTCSTVTGAGCGTLSNPTITSVTYTAPPAVSATTNVTLTATSVADPIVIANVTITIDIAPTFTTTNIPTSAMNGTPYTTTIVATGGVIPLTYSIASGSLPAGLTLNSDGVISGTPTFDGPGASMTSNFSVQVTDYNLATAVTPLALSITVAAPPPIQGTASLPQGFLGAQYSGTIASSGGVPPLTFGLMSGSLPPGLSMTSTGGQITGLPTATGAYPFTVTISDSALPTHQTFPVPASITISQPPTLQITTTSLPNGATASGYGALLQAKGGIPPYNWSVISGQLPAGLNLATQSNNTALISGNPILAGTSTFTVQVTDSDSTPQTLSAQYTITITSGTNSNSLFSGSYTFLFQGYDSDGPMAVAGTLTTDGRGDITAGYEDSNRASGNIQNAVLTGTYSIGLNGADGRGTLELISTPSLQAPLIVDYQLVLDSSGNIHMIENNDTNTNTDTKSTHGAGILKPVTQAAFSVASFSGNYAFELSGQDYNLKPIAMAGVMHADGNSKLTPITGDLNDAGTLSPLQSPSGEFGYTAAALRGTSALLYGLSGKAQTQLQFAMYFVSPTDVYFVETDTPLITDQFPRMSGEAVLQQTGAVFGSSSFAGESVVTGTGLNGSNASVMAGLLTAPACDGVTADVSLSYDQNNGGATSSVAPAASTCVVASNGRATFASLDPRLGVAYLTGPGQGFILGGDPAVTTGLLELQTPTAFNTSTAGGSYALSAAPPGDAATPSTVGQVASVGNGSIPGTLDEVDALGTPAHLGQSFLLTIGSLTANGRGTMVSNPATGFPINLIFYMLSPSQIRLIPFDSNPGKGHPDVISLNH